MKIDRHRMKFCRKVKGLQAIRLGVLAGALLVSATALASVGVSLQQSRNGSGTSPISPVNFVNGNAGASNAHYAEGWSIPYRAVLTGLTPGQTVTLVIGFDNTHSGRHAIDYITHYDRLQPHVGFDTHAQQETVDPVRGISGLEGQPPDDEYPIPSPTNSIAAVGMQPIDSFNLLPPNEKVISIWNGTFPASCDPDCVAYVSEGDLTLAATETQVAITFEANSSTVVLAWGGHISNRNDWGFDASGVSLAASGINGSPYHMRLKQLTVGGVDQNTGNQDRSLSANAVDLCAGAVCGGEDQCNYAATCNPSTGACGAPTPKPNGSECSDGNACTQTDTCQSGVCVGSNPVVCTAKDQCYNIGTCDRETGSCTEPVKANGTVCNDGLFCTTNDQCIDGVCQGSSRDCSALGDQCNIGVCNEAAASCVKSAKDDGTACSDGNLCTRTDTCQAGTCVGGNPVTCSPLDQCHVAGVCNAATGVCSNANAANGTICNADNNICTNPDTCQDGKCIAGPLAVIAPSS